MSNVKVSQFPVEVVEGDTPPVKVAQFPVEVVEGGEPGIQVAGFVVETVHQADARAIDVYQFIVEVICSPTPAGDFMPMLQRFMG